MAFGSIKPNATPTEVTTANDTLAADLAASSEAIRQARAGADPDAALLWIVGDEAGVKGDAFINYAKQFIETALRDGSRSTINGVTNARWFSEYFYFAKCKGYAPGKTMDLPDTVWRYSYRSGAFEEVPIASVLKAAKSDDVARLNSALKDYIDAAKNLDVANVGPNVGESVLTTDDIEQLIPAAEQYWLDAGALPSVLANLQIGVGELDAGIAAQTQGNRITLSADGAGWGWFVDDTPQDSAEFTQTGGSEWLAPGGSASSQKLDLLSVMIHEMGHALGLEHAATGTMEAVLQPGERRLPADLEEGLMRNLRSAVTAQLSTSLTAPTVLPVGQYQVVANPAFVNGDQAHAWSSIGEVSFQNGAVTLVETLEKQTRLNQVFVLGPNDRFLSFTLSGIALDDMNNAPDDAFEAALIDANTGLSLLGNTGLSHNDAILNLQADGTEYKASGVTTVKNADGSRTVLVDLAGLERYGRHRL